MKSRQLGLYSSIDIQGRVENATPAQLIQMLYEGLLQSLYKASSAITEQQFDVKSAEISRALSIVAELQSSLDSNVDSDLPHNLSLLYQYITERLLSVNQNLDLDVLNEVISLIDVLKQGWDELVTMDQTDKKKL